MMKIKVCVSTLREPFYGGGGGGGGGGQEDVSKEIQDPIFQKKYPGQEKLSYTLCIICK